MRRTPWKLVAGGLVLSVGGLAAVGGVPLRAGQVACVQQPEPVIPALPPVAQPVPAPPLPEPTTAPPTIVLTPADLPPVPAPPPVIQARATETAPLPRTTAERVLDLSIQSIHASEPTPVVGVTFAQPTPITPIPSTPTPVATPPIPAPTGNQLPQAFEVRETTPPQQATPSPAPQALEKKLKVMLHMGDDRPRFEVRDGEECYLKVVCDRVDVKSPSDRGESMSVLKATGKVAFVTPGGEGECEELSVVPGTGQVIVSGKVAFKYNWGKVETTVSGDRMTFRLGSAPGMAPGTVPASFQQRR